MSVTSAARGCAACFSLLVLGACLSPAAAQYNAEIARWNAQDALDPVSDNGLVFVGSSSIRRWEQLTHDFADYNVVQRGIGGALFDDVVAQVNDLVLDYSPRGVVVWAGTNDLASGSNGAEVAADYQNFVSAVHNSLPNTHIFYLGVMPTPGRQGNRPQEDIANSTIAAAAAGDSRLHYIDLPAAFETLNPYGGAGFTSKFVDSIHLNRDGYDFWTTIIRPQIEAAFAPDKPLAVNPNSLAIGESLLMDFGPTDSSNGLPTASPDSRGNHWNNWTSRASGGLTVNAGEHIGGLVTTSGDATEIGLVLTAGFQLNGFNHGGLLNPDENLLGDFADHNATGDFFFSTADGLQGGGDDDTGGGFMLTGLNPDYLYEFEFFGSRNTSEQRITEYRVHGANESVIQLATSGNNIGADGMYDGNDDQTAVLVDVQPDEFGQVFVDLTLIQGQFAYINAMQVTATGSVVPEPSAAAALLGLLGGASRRSRR
ncbi:GDSL-like Lipase/Acylhydrolase [Posidoniimonas polymericola]|uniref:GDSL-like Lipase/Acylhydrolase n=1 Tax=Posidoniimonas polymericola TaxID=2528002 RepID=A0A5C5YT36_9BACT|nr:GDSL-type esterase/lipase family protein [Posidoniimonas polymericola]TWT78125.1 GDSL-like Lipase/Acylhydrolase [Posidoniimonas polymericola]